MRKATELAADAINHPPQTDSFGKSIDDVQYPQRPRPVGHDADGIQARRH